MKKIHSQCTCTDINVTLLLLPQKCYKLIINKIIIFHTVIKYILNNSFNTQTLIIVYFAKQTIDTLLIRNICLHKTRGTYRTFHVRQSEHKKNKKEDNRKKLCNYSNI